MQLFDEFAKYVQVLGFEWVSSVAVIIGVVGARRIMKKRAILPRQRLLLGFVLTIVLFKSPTTNSAAGV